MSISVQNNSSALLALQNLNRTNDQLTQVQDQIATGLLLGTPKDNPTVWATAHGQQVSIDGLTAVTTSLNRAAAISDTALSAGQSVIDLLNQLKQEALTGQDAQLPTSSRQALNTDFAGLLTRVANTISSASF